MLCSSVVLVLLVQFLWLSGSPAEAVGPDPFLGQAASLVADSVKKLSLCSRLSTEPSGSTKILIKLQPILSNL